MAHYENDWQGWWTTHELTGQKSAAWERAISDCYLDWNLTRSVDDEFEAKIRQRTIGDIRLVECSCGPCSGKRALNGLAREGGPFIGIQAVLSGQEKFIIDGRSTTVSCGELVLWNSHQNAEFLIEDQLEKITLLLPQSVLQSRLQLGEMIKGGVIKANSGIGRLLFAHICELARNFEADYEDNGFGPKWATVELSAAASQSLQQPFVEAPKNHLRRIQMHILENLQDPDLNLRSIAAANGISVRYLHSLFAAADTTASKWILEQRLERCYDALSGRLNSRCVVKDVAFQWGFADQSHFSRVFKKQYGVSPIKYWRKTHGLD